MPTVLRSGPYRFFFFSNETNETPHIHVEAADAYAKFWLKPVGLVYSSRFPAGRLTEIRKLVEENKNIFVEKWHEYFGKT